MARASWRAEQARRSRRIRELELEIGRRLTGCEARSTNRFVSNRPRRPELWSPGVFERWSHLKGVALQWVLSATLADHLGSDARRVLVRVSKRNRRATTRPPVLAAEVVVGQQLRMHRPPARFVVVCAKAG